MVLSFRHQQYSVHRRQLVTAKSGVMCNILQLLFYKKKENINKKVTHNEIVKDLGQLMGFCYLWNWQAAKPQMRLRRCLKLSCLSLL